MQPTCRQVPPRNGSFSTTIVLSPNSPARMAATYPPGPLPIIATSYFATHSLPSGESVPVSVQMGTRLIERLRRTRCRTVPRRIMNVSTPRGEPQLSDPRTHQESLSGGFLSCAGKSLLQQGSAELGDP